MMNIKTNPCKMVVTMSCTVRRDFRAAERIVANTARGVLPNRSFVGGECRFTGCYRLSGYSPSMVNSLDMLEELNSYPIS